MAKVYHIYKDGDTLDDGYIGVSVDATNRIKYHLSKLEINSHPNKKLQEAYDDNYKTKILLEGDESYCYYIENKLRPKSNMGLNIAVGGKLPPIITNPNCIKKGINTRIERYGDKRTPGMKQYLQKSIETKTHPWLKCNRETILGNEFTTKTAHKLSTERSFLKLLPAQISSNNGTHHWFDIEHSNEVSKRNILMFTGTVTVTNKNGKNIRILKQDFLNQQISINNSEWEYVGVASKEAIKRRNQRGAL